MIRIADIQRTVARHYGLPTSDMTSRRQDYARSRPRQVAMCLATRLTGHSLNRIGDFFGGRDHSTVIHAVKAVQARAEVQPTLRRLTKQLLIEPRVGQ